MDEAGVAGWVTSDELAEAGRFVREGRRREYLTWRAVVRRELGADVRIAYDAAGAPVVDRDGVYVGVSHCRGRVAVVCPMSPARSTSNPRRGISAVPRRVTCPPPSWRCPAIRCCLPLSGAPRRRSTNMPGARGWILLHDLRVEAVDFAAGTVVGRIGGGEAIRLTLHRADGFITVYTV